MKKRLIFIKGNIDPVPRRLGTLYYFPSYDYPFIYSYPRTVSGMQRPTIIEIDSEHNPVPSLTPMSQKSHPKWG